MKMSMTSLFRSEAVEHQTSIREGRPLIGVVPGWWPILSLIGGGLLAAVAVLTLLRFDQRLRAEGVIEPRGGLITVPAPMDGTVTEVAVQLTEVVELGAPLLALAGASLEPELARTQEQRRVQVGEEIDGLTALRRSRETAATGARHQLAAQRQSLVDGQRKMDEELSLQQQRVALSEQEIPQMRALGARGLISAIQVRAAENQALEMRMQASRLERERAGQQREIGRIERDLADLEDQQMAADFELRQRIGTLSEEQSRLTRAQHARVHAPTQGVVATLLVRPGQSVMRGESLLALAREADELVVSLRVPAASPGRIDVGAPVVMRSPAFPPARHGYLKGVVLAVSGATLSSGQAGNGNDTRGDEPAFEVRVSLDTNAAAAGFRLRPGMRIDADIVLRRRRVIDLLLEPLQSGLQAVQ